MFPELHGNRTRVAKSLYKKSAEYRDESSLFLMTLVEIIAWMDAEPLYIELRKVVKETKVNLQVSYPIESDKLEINLFVKRQDPKEVTRLQNGKFPNDIAPNPTPDIPQGEDNIETEMSC